MVHMVKLLLIAAMVAIGGGASAQGFPSGPIRIIVPFQAGGLTDILARTVAQHMSEGLATPVLVENRPGASGNIGADAVAKSAPDGQTLLMGSIGTNAVNQLLYSKMPYDTTKDFAPISLVGYGTLLLVVNPSVPAKDLKELLALARAKPGSLSYASGGSGASQHLAGELLKSMTGIDILHIPYKGITQGVTDVLAGQVSMTFDLATVMPHVKTGKLRPIAVANRTRATALPDVPTIAEAGVPGYDWDSWTGFLAPTGTPPAIVAQVHAEAARITKLPDIRERLTAAGFEMVGSSPEAFAAIIRDNNARLGKVIRDAGIKAE